MFLPDLFDFRIMRELQLHMRRARDLLNSCGGGSTLRSREAAALRSMQLENFYALYGTRASLSDVFLSHTFGFSCGLAAADMSALQIEMGGKWVAFDEGTTGTLALAALARGEQKCARLPASSGACESQTDSLTWSNGRERREDLGRQLICGRTSSRRTACQRRQPQNSRIA